MTWLKGKLGVLGVATLLNPGQLVFIVDEGETLVLEAGDRLIGSYVAAGKPWPTYILTVAEFEVPARLSCGIMETFIVVGYNDGSFNDSTQRYWDRYGWRETLFEQGEWRFELEVRDER